MRTVLGVLLGATVGVLCTSFGLIEVTAEGISTHGGNDFTPLLTGGGALVGAAIGATGVFRRHLFAILFLGLGLLLAIALRDAHQLQPPIVFFDLFGISLVAATVGAWLDAQRENNKMSPGLAVGIVFCSIAITAVAVIGLARNVGTGGNCRDRGSTTVCGPLLR